MGLVGNLNGPAPVLPSSVSSVDGALRVTADPSWGGASIVCDFSTRSVTNYQPDPFFTAGDGGYSSFSNGTSELDTTRAKFGPQSLKVTTTSDGTNFTYNGNLITSTTGMDRIYASVWVYAHPANSGTGGPLVRIGGGGVAASNSPRVEVTGEWVRLDYDVPVDSDNTALMYLYGGDATGDVVWFDGVYLSDKPLPKVGVFDGDAADTVTDAYEWDGTPHASPSTHTAYPTTPHSIRIHRRTPDGETVAVRGADPNLSPGGISPGYDHEAPLGVPVTWWADALDRTGNVLYTSDEAVLTIPWPDTTTAWLKPIADPRLSRRVFLSGWEEAGRDARTSIHPIHGRTAAAATLRTPRTRQVSVTVVTNTRDEYHDMAALLDSGVLVLDATDKHGIEGPLHLVRVGDLPVPRNGNLPDWTQRMWTFEAEVVDRPPTPGSVMRTPAVSWATLTYSTYTEMGNANPQWLDLWNG